MSLYPMTLNDSVKLAVTTSSARVALNDSALNPEKTSLLLQTRPTDPEMWVKIGDSTVTATADVPCFLMQPGSIQVFGLRPTDTHVAAITASGSGTLYGTAGHGA